MKRIIVGFVGPSGAGKSEVGKHLVAGRGFVRVHAGQAVKDALRYGFGLHMEQVDGPLIGMPTKDLGGATPRALLEAMGAAIQTVAPGATAVRLASELNGWAHDCERVFVDGIRRASEATAVRKAGGIVIRISRPGTGDESLPCDVFQLGVNADHKIVNSGSIAELLAAADRIIDSAFPDKLTA